MNNLMFKISYGLYVLSAKEGGKQNGCMTNTLIQLTSQPNRLGVTINKSNLTHDMLLKSGVGAASVLSVETDFETIKTFGMSSGREHDKFQGRETLETASGILVPKAFSIGYFEFKVINTVDVGTHTSFICDLTEEKFLENKEPLTYAYYQSNIKPRPQAALESRWVCKVCGYSTTEEIGDDFICPVCKHTREVFEKVYGKVNS